MSEPTSKERPLLVLEHVERDPSRLIGTVRLAGCAQRVVVDVGNPLGLIEYLDIALLLGAHDPSLSAVVQAMYRWHDGEELGFPLDLSQRVRDTDSPVPFQPLSADDRDLLDAEADRVDRVLLDVERSRAQARSASGVAILNLYLLAAPKELVVRPGLRRPAIRPSSFACRPLIRTRPTRFPKDYWGRYYDKNYSGPIGQTFTREDQSKISDRELVPSKNEVARTRCHRRSSAGYALPLIIYKIHFSLLQLAGLNVM